MRAGRGDPGDPGGSSGVSSLRRRLLCAHSGARCPQPAGPGLARCPPPPHPGFAAGSRVEPSPGGGGGEALFAPPPSSPGGTKSPGSRPVLPGCWRSRGGAGRLCPGLLSLCSGIPPGRPRELLLLRDFGDHQQGAAVRTSNVNTGVSTKGNCVSGRFKEERRAREAWRTPVRKPQKPPLGTGGPAGMVGPQDRWCRNLLAKICCLQ